MDATAMASAEAQMNTIQTRVTEGFTAAGGTNPTALPWAQIIQFIFSLFANGGVCPKPTPTPAKAPADAAAEIAEKVKHPRVCQMQLTLANMAQGFPQPRKLAQGMMTAMEATKPEESVAYATTAHAMQTAVDGIPTD